ncbi:MAG: cell division protein SepF [Clostridiales bacterium]|nr:cell division protein SepF [Clostridiales bacterium]
MPFVDRVRSFMSRIASGPYDKVKPTESNLPNGGHTGYHPIAPKKQRMKDYNAYTAQDGYDQTYDNAQQNAWQDPNAGAQPQQPWGQGWQQDPTQSQNAWGTSWQQAQPWQLDPSMQGTMASSYFTQNNPPMTNESNPAPQQNGYMPQQNGYAQPQSAFAQPNAQPAFEQKGFAQQPAQQRPVSGQSGPVNMGQMHYMPGQFVHEDGVAYTHVERLAQPLSSSSCFRLIDFMRNGESIIVNTELIQDERENSHCLDLLYGAAFTMGYTFTKISRLRIYLISPANICVLPYGTIKQLNDEEVSRRWPGSIPQPKSQTPSGFDFERLDRKAAGEIDNYMPQRRYS